jgi:hypothetical protein
MACSTAIPLYAMKHLGWSRTKAEEFRKTTIDK